MGLMIGNDNWWRTHGIGCSPIAMTGSGAGSGTGTQWEESEDTCLVPYTVIETVHASIFMFLTVNYHNQPKPAKLIVIAYCYS